MCLNVRHQTKVEMCQNMEINFICNYINTRKHIFDSINASTSRKWYYVYFHQPRLPPRKFPEAFEGEGKRKESWLMSMASPENEQISNVFIPFWIPCSLVMSWMYARKFIALYMNFNKQFSNEWVRKFLCCLICCSCFFFFLFLCALCRHFVFHFKWVSTL